MRILGFGTYDVARHPRAGIILDGLGGHGDEIIQINEPLGFTTGERVEMLGNSWLAYRFVLRTIARWVRLILTSLHMRRGGRYDAVLVGHLGHFDVLLARALFPRCRIVLDLLIFAGDTARDRGVTDVAKLRMLDTLDSLAIRCADVVVLDTSEHVDLLHYRARGKAVVVPVGARAEWFRAGDKPPRRHETSSLRVIFFGLYTPLQGATIIGRALALLTDRPDITVTMIGTGQEYAKTYAHGRVNRSVSWRAWIPPAELPAVVASHDICLGIFGTTPKASRVVPNKVYEGAAAGCAIVTSDTPPQRRAFGEAARYLPAGDAAALARALRELADDPQTRNDLAVAARHTALARFTASDVVGPLRDILMS